MGQRLTIIIEEEEYNENRRDMTDPSQLNRWNSYLTNHLQHAYIIMSLRIPVIWNSDFGKSTNGTLVYFSRSMINTDLF